MNSETLIHILIDLIIIGVLIYIYRSNKRYFIVSVLILLYLGALI